MTSSDDAVAQDGRPGAPTPPPCVILHAPQLAENIGAVARVMANFGLDELRLVKPRDGWPQERAWASASGADWPLDNARVFERVEDAIADLELVFATTARPRETQLKVMTPREAAGELHQARNAGVRTGLLFGGERAGLETADIALCHGVVTVPIDPRFRSLNLAQAVAINAYEWRLGVLDRPPPAFREGPPPAEQAMMIGLFEHLEDELETAGPRGEEAGHGAQPARRARPGPVHRSGGAHLPRRDHGAEPRAGPGAGQARREEGGRRRGVALRPPRA
jgi:tRNA/rRNA methyltransferase